jgi:hypothetical protein
LSVSRPSLSFLRWTWRWSLRKPALVVANSYVPIKVKVTK